MADLRLDSLTIVCPGDKSFRLDKRIDALGLSQLNS